MLKFDIYYSLKLANLPFFCPNATCANDGCCNANRFWYVYTDIRLSHNIRKHQYPNTNRKYFIGP